MICLVLGLFSWHPFLMTLAVSQSSFSPLQPMHHINNNDDDLHFFFFIPSVFPLYVRSHTHFLPLWLPHQNVCIQDKKAVSLDPAGSLCFLCPFGCSGHLLQQAPKWQTSFDLLAWCRWRRDSVGDNLAVTGSTAPPLPLSGQRLVAG